MLYLATFLAGLCAGLFIVAAIVAMVDDDWDSIYGERYEQ